MSLKVAYVYNVCMHYKVPLLSRVASQPDINLHGFFSQSHWKNSKLHTVKNINEFSLSILPTLDVFMPYKGRGLHIFWNPTLFSALYRFRPNVIIAGADNFPNNLFVVLYARRFKIPYIWRGLGSMYDYETILRRFLNIPLRWFLANADAGIAFNTAAKAYYIKKYDYPAERIFVATNLIDTEKVELERQYFSPMVITKRQELGLEGMKTVLFVGCLEPAKRVDYLLRAFAEIQPNVSNVVLLIVGDGSTRSDLEKLSVELKLDNVIFLGRHISDANLYFMLGDIFVLPGLGGLAISQAMSHGLPVISGKADGTELDLIINGENGYILSSNNPVKEISQKLVMLLLDDRLRIKMGQKSRQLISEQFNINRTALIFTQAVRSVLN